MSSNDSYADETPDTILGQDFLTWLWFRSETSPNIFIDDHGTPFSILLSQRIVVQGGEGDSRETTSVSGGRADGEHVPLREARIGLLTGKKVTRALLSLEQDGLQWQTTVKADDFSLGSFRTPKVAADEDDDPDALFFEKVYLIERGISLFDSMYKLFLNVRISQSKWDEEASSIGKWIASQE